MMDRKNVILFLPSNKRSVAIETIAAQVNKAGHHLVVITSCEKGDLHEQLDKLGITYHTKVFNSNSVLNYFRYTLYLVSFCRKNKINTVWSHLQNCNLPAVLAQYFIKARVVAFRHHFHAIIKTEGLNAVNKKELRIGKVVSRLAREIVVPSIEVFQGMVTYEKVPPEKLSILPYIYDFTLYDRPNMRTVDGIRAQHPARMLIVVASRMVKMKRHMLVLPVFKKLIEEGLDIKVLLLDEGEERASLEQYVEDNGLKNQIFFAGYQRNIIDYIFAADLLVHPSYTEASSSLVKEFGLAEKPVIVCRGIGDFDEYIEHGVNGFLVDSNGEADQFEKYIRLVYNEPEKGKQIGKQLHKRVQEFFSANKKTVERYLAKL